MASRSVAMWSSVDMPMLRKGMPHSVHHARLARSQPLLR
jgi:hypothetical protein